jgi:hypothetical protein
MGDLRDGSELASFFLRRQQMAGATMRKSAMADGILLIVAEMP